MEKAIKKSVVQWDIKNWSRAMSLWEKDLPDDLSGKKVLDIGGGGGGLSVFFALKGADVYCTDLTLDREAEARQNFEKWGVCDKIRYEQLDVTKMSYKQEFDIVVFKSVMGGVGWNNNYHNQQLMFENIYEGLKNGGTLYFAENLVASPLHQWARKKFAKWGTSWRYITIEEAKELATRFKSFTYATYGILGVFGRKTFLAEVFGTIDSVFDRFVKEHNRYIISAVCKKQI